MLSTSRSLHRLLYSSRVSPAAAADLDHELGSILGASIANNRHDAITGLLVCVQGCFVQALEGPAEKVQLAFGRISRDARHSDPTVIAAGPAEKRLFGEWNMCARVLAPSDAAILDVIDSKGEFEPEALTPTSALRLLTTVAGIQRETALQALTG